MPTALALIRYPVALLWLTNIACITLLLAPGVLTIERVYALVVCAVASVVLLVSLARGVRCAGCGVPILWTAARIGALQQLFAAPSLHCPSCGKAQQRPEASPREAVSQSPAPAAALGAMALLLLSAWTLDFRLTIAGSWVGALAKVPVLTARGWAAVGAAVYWCAALMVTVSWAWRS
jgi:hypothetical protein